MLRMQPKKGSIIMQQISHDTPHLPVGMLTSTLRMQQLVVQGEIETMQRYRIALRKAKDGQGPFPADLIDHARAMHAWIQQNLAFFGECWLFPVPVDEQCNALVATLHHSESLIEALLEQLRTISLIESARTRREWQSLLSPLGTVEQAYDTIAQRQATLGERLAELEAASETTSASCEQHRTLPPTVSTTELEQLATQVENYLTAFGLSSLSVSVHPREQRVHVNDLALIIRPIQASATPANHFHVPGWEHTYPSSASVALGDVTHPAWELAASVLTPGADGTRTLHYCTMVTRSIKEAAIEAALWFVRRDMWKWQHLRLMPISPDNEIAEGETIFEEETISVYHLSVICEPEHLDLILDALSRLLAEHQSHASVVDVFTSAIRNETTLHFFSDDPIAAPIEQWLKKADGMIDYSITQALFHLSLEEATMIG